MGRYDTKSDRDLHGIATHTNNSLPLDNIQKFKPGTRVMCNDDGGRGTVQEVDKDSRGCVVAFDDREVTWLETEHLSLE